MAASSIDGHQNDKTRKLQMQPEGAHDNCLSEDSGKVRVLRKQERSAGYLLPQFSGNADSAGIDTQLFAPFTHQQILPDFRHSRGEPGKISRF